MPIDESYDSFACARLTDSMKVLEERKMHFDVAGHQHQAFQDLANGGWIEESITIRWRPKHLVNGFDPTEHRS